MRIYADHHPHLCEKTGTSAKVTEAISQDSSTVKKLVANLKSISNDVYGDKFKQNRQTDKLVELTSTENINAKQLQQYARATKQVFRNSYKDICKSYDATEGQTRPGSNAAMDKAKAYKAYQLAKAIQHNDPTMLRSNIRANNK